MLLVICGFVGGLWLLLQQCPWQKLHPSAVLWGLEKGLDPPAPAFEPSGWCMLLHVP